MLTKYSGAELTALLRPCVYVWRRAGGECLYVGYTRNGLGRFPCHHVIGKAAELLADDTLEFHHVDGDDAKALEARNDADYSAGPSP